MIETFSMGTISAMMAIAAAVEEMPRPFPAVNLDTGDALYTIPTAIELEQDFPSWNSAWQRYMGVTPIGNTNGASFPTAARPPAVDLDQNDVLVVFGHGPVSGYRLVDSFVEKRKVHVRLSAVQLSSRTNLGGVDANPYAFIVFPKSKYPMVVEFPSTDQNGNTVWQQVAKFPGATGSRD